MKPARTLEIGLACGASALAFAATQRMNGCGHHTAIDPLQQSLYEDEGIRNIAAAGLAIDLVRVPSAEALPALPKSSFDLIYIDGSHHFDEVLIDVYHCMRLLRIGGVMLLDDCTIPDVAKVLRWMRRNMSYCMVERDLSRHHPAGGTMRYQVARRLHYAQLAGFERVGDPDSRHLNQRGVMDF